jgi:acyl carrier protein
MKDMIRIFQSMTNEVLNDPDRSLDPHPDRNLDPHPDRHEETPETILIRLFSRLLDKPADLESHFFQLGGSSLRAIQLISLINKTLSVRLSLRTLFSAPTIKALAAIIRGSDKREYEAIQNAPDLKFYPLSHAQRRLWIIDQLRKDQVAYNMPRAYLLSGDLDVSAMNNTFRTLVERHEILRTTFAIVEGQPVQRIHPPEERPFLPEWQDIRDGYGGEEDLQMLTEANAMTPFKLSTGPLLSVRLIRLEDNKYLFLLNIHHIISDGWSMQVLINEILTLYEAFREGKPHGLEPLRIQYKDFTCWQNHQLEGPALEEHRQYWEKRFAQRAPVPALPFSFRRPAVRSFRGDKKTWPVNPDLKIRIAELCRQKEASLIMGLQASVKALL